MRIACILPKGGSAWAFFSPALKALRGRPNPEVLFLPVYHKRETAVQTRGENESQTSSKCPL